jgi:hypothetical protein
MSNPNQVHRFADDEVYCFLEQDSYIMLKAASDGDAVELSAEEAREIASVLLAMAKRLDHLDNQQSPAQRAIPL